MAIIIGKGLLANTFTSSVLDSKFVLFASGVSNSAETRASEFMREQKLLERVIYENSHSTIIYFSTCSVYQKNRVAYIQHKLNMEKILVSKAKYYHIYRLPQVVGVVNNTTLVSFFVRAILDKSKVYIQSDAKRNLISVDDVYKVVEKVSFNNSRSSFIMNLAGACSINVESILVHISNIIGIKPDYVLVPGGDSYEISLSRLTELYNNNDIIFSDLYWQSVLNKCVPKLIKLIERDRL